MKELETALLQDYSSISKQINSMNTDDKNYQLAFEERDKVRKEWLELKKIASEEKREKTRNIINVSEFVVTIGCSLLTVYSTFRFDKSATITSTLGRGILNGAVSKLVKR